MAARYSLLNPIIDRNRDQELARPPPSLASTSDLLTRYESAVVFTVPGNRRGICVKGTTVSAARARRGGCSPHTLLAIECG